MSVQALHKAVEIVGGQSALARALKVSQGNIWNWLHRNKRVPAGRVLAVEEATEGKVSRHDLRPDLYPKDAMRLRKAKNNT